MSARVTVARVTTAVLTLSQLAQAGDKRALEQFEAMAALLDSPHRSAQAVPRSTN
jgi:hypothetical protein